LLHLASGMAATRADTGMVVDLVLANGRVMDPESGLDAIRNVGLSDGKIAAISENPLESGQVIDVTGLVVAPGFIDLHAHGQDDFSSRLQALDGVTTHLELEIGVYPVATWYESMQGKSVINYGATAGHEAMRVKITDGIEIDYSDPGKWRSRLPARPARWADEPLSPEEVKTLIAMLQQGLEEGGLGVGIGLSYTPGASREEIWRAFQVAAQNDVLTFVHVRHTGTAEPASTVDAIQELIADAASVGGGLQIAHIGSTGRDQIPFLLEMIDSAYRNGVDVRTEVYPWGAAQTAIGAPIFDEGWEERTGPGASVADLEWVATGERLTPETFARYRKEQPRGSVIAHVIPADMVDYAIAHAGVMIISDGPRYDEGHGHPRGAGTFARVLGRYVRERHVLSLMDALGKMTVLPAQRMQKSVPQMAQKGRIAVGADADITVFDPDRVIERATYQNPTQPSVGIEHVIVGGAFVVRDAKPVENVFPGQAIRRESTR